MAGRARHALLPPLAVALIVCLAVPVQAQRAVISVSGPGLPPGTDLLDVASGRVTRLASDSTEAAVFTADGAVLLRRVRGDARWWARWLATGTELPLPAGFGAQTVVVPPVLTVHPRATAVFGPYLTAAQRIVPSRVDAAGLRLFPGCPSAAYYTSLDVSPDGRRLFVLCPAVFNGPEQAVMILDSASGAELRRVAVPGAIAVSVVAGRDGTVFLAVHLDVTNGRFTVDRVDVMTGVTEQSVTFPFPASQAVQVDLVANPRRPDQPLLVRCRDIGQELPLLDCTARTLDVATLTEGAQVQHAGRPPGMHFPASGADVVISAGTQASLVHLDSGRPVAVIDAPPGGFVLAAWGAEPGAPVLAAPVVQGASVTLRWTLPETSAPALGYRVEAGSAPGLANLLVQATGASLSLSGHAVPAGRYFVRVRAANGNGVSAPSNEVVVDVP